MTIVLIHLIRYKKGSIQRWLGKVLCISVIKRTVWMLEKIIKRLMYICPPTKYFYEDVLFQFPLHNIVTLRQSF